MYFFSTKKIPVQLARFFVCLVHKVHMAQNIIFKGILLLQIYIPLYKKIKTQFLPLFVLQNHPMLTVIFKRNSNFAIFNEKSAYFRAQKRSKFIKYFFPTFFTEEIYTFHTSINKNMFRGIFHLIIFMAQFVMSSFTISDT